MNLLLLEEADFIAADRVVLRDRRLVHMQDVHRATVGDNLRVGRIGGLMGNAQVLRLEAHEAELQVAFDLPPPAKLPLTLLLALPTPENAAPGAADRRRHGRAEGGAGQQLPRGKELLAKPPSWSPRRFASN